MKQRISIGELAKATGVKVVTIRYYEQVGLMAVPSRTEGNYRAYNTESVRRLQFIRRLRDLGFTLDEVRDLLRLSSEKNRPCDEVDRITHEHLATVEKKLQDLEKLAAELRRLSRCCRGGGRIAECRIIEALSPVDCADANISP
jgi:DNA-binding transcriptional MerR regulator